jgi:signal transduction histidine kinase
MVLAAPDIVDRDFRLAFWTIVVIVYTIFRTVKPIPNNAPSFRRSAELVAGAGLMAIAAASTGYFLSPLAFSTLTAVAVAGFSAGFASSIRLAVATALAVGVPMLLDSSDRPDDFRTTVQWTVELVLVGIVTGYARRISGEADERHSEALDRVRRLVDANQLLFNLHQVAQDLPASLDLDEVLESTIGRLRELLTFDSAAVVLLEETDDSWHVARRFGARLPSHLSDAELPPPIRSAAESDAVVTEPNLLRRGGPGLSPRAESGVYVALRARGALVGVIAIEHGDAFHFSTRDADLLDGFSEAAALAIDNARWFARLRTVGADEERTRIARDLHDRIGQSLAYLAFELDRIVKKDERHDPVSEDLSGLREDVRGVVREVRDTLYDLRTDVSDDRDVESVLREFAGRIEERTGMTVTLRIDQTARMPRLQERELWRIAQEAMINAERHSGGTHIDVFWYSDGVEAIAEVRDDGGGMPLGRVGRLDSYGMLGMRERASSIGASLSIDSIPGRGVTVRVSVRNP